VLDADSFQLTGGGASAASSTAKRLQGLSVRAQPAQRRHSRANHVAIVPLAAGTARRFFVSMGTQLFVRVNGGITVRGFTRSPIP